jgi:hypothetical protein
LAELLLEEESEALARKAVEMALGGDAAALRLCLDRLIAPRRERPVPFALPPINGADDMAAAMAAVARGVADGTLAPAEAFAISQMVDTFVRAIDARGFERRLRRLEEANGASR